jgi:16S rRNA (adenine1518-N6/adenine1519-N6)-dimethyltransferase
MTTKPRFGQNFLIDPSASLAIVEALGDISAATVLEIGPGKGAITRLLATRARRLIAVELDPTFVGPLRQSLPKIEVLNQDILTTRISALAATEKLAVVGNLPYYITSQILLHLFEHHHAIDRAVIMVQREVADRIAAHPGSRDYGLLTATTQLYSRVDNLFTLSPSAFAPPPDVHSTVLRLVFEPHYKNLGVDPVEFVAFLKQSFAQKRKTLSNNLRFAGFNPAAISTAFNIAQIPAGIRAEALPLEAAAKLFLALGVGLKDAHP